MPPDRGKILAGLIIFLVLSTAPFWLRLARGTGERKDLPLDARGRPVLVMPAGEKSCVEPADYMRAKHMDLLNLWRDGFVREPEKGRVWHSQDGRTHKMSLTGTCLRCHEKAGFCDRCHSFMGEKSGERGPYCFECHLSSPTANSLTPAASGVAR